MGISLLIIVGLWVVMVFIPGVRMFALAPLLWVMFPLLYMGKRSMRTPPSPARTLVRGSAEVPLSAARVFAQHGPTLAELGFVESGVCLSMTAIEGLTVMQSRWSNAAAKTDAWALCVMSGDRGPGGVGVIVAMTVFVYDTEFENGVTLATVSGPVLPPVAVDRNYRRYDLPRVRDIRALWRAHTALLAREKMGEPKPVVPDEQTAAEIDKAQRRLEETEIAAGLARRGRDGKCRLRFRGACIVGWCDVWPWVNRRRRRVREGEERLLKELGMGDVDLAAAPAPETVSPILRIADDRGEPRGIAGGVGTPRGQDERSADPRFNAVLARAAAMRKVMMRPKRGRMWLVILPVLVVGMVTMVVLKLPVWVVFLIYFPLVMMCSIFLGRPGKVFEAEGAAAGTILEHGLCPSCLYGLRGLETGADGCVVCPECGGAWRADRVREFVDFKTATQETIPGAAVVSHWWRRAGEMGTGYRDHRGRECALVPPRLTNELALASGEKRARLERARGKIAKSGRIARWVVGGFVLLVSVTMTGASVAVGIHRNSAAFPLLAGVWIFAVFGVLGLTILRGNFGYSRKKIIRAMLEERFCPSCAKDLSAGGGGGAPPTASDGTTTCPGCGAGWRVN